MAIDSDRGTDRHGDIPQLLRGVSVLAELDDALLTRVANEVRSVSLSAGEWLFHTGDRADAAYVIAAGRMEVVIEHPRETVIRVLRRGAALGELGLLHAGQRAAGIRARGNATLIGLHRQAFEALMRDSPSFALAVTREIAGRLATNLGSTEVREPPGTLAIIPLDAAAPVLPIAEAVADELGRAGTVARIDGAPSAGPRDWYAHLGRLEAEHDRVLLVCEAPEPRDPWTSFCLREADRTVAVSRRNPIDGWFQAKATLLGCDLLLTSMAAGTELAERLPARIVRRARDDAALQRVGRELARRAAARAVGLVLSGGGARALAHAGVLEELTRAGVRIDRTGGVSLGAVIAAFVARGDTPEQICERLHHYFIEHRPTNDYTLPLVSLIRGRKTARMLSTEFGHMRIEDLELPFFCTSTDPRSRELVVHRTGPLAQALLASLSIPGVFPPASDGNGRMLVDGGVLDNLPVATMAADVEGPVIAVDVTGLSSPVRAVTHRPRLAPMRAAIRRMITGSEERLPPLPETIVRCMTLASADTVAAARSHADLVIVPDTGAIGLLDWRRLPEMRAAGAEAARLALQESGELLATLRAD